MRPTTRYAKSGDYSIAYQVVGDAPLDLVYVPGFVSHVEHAWEDPDFALFLGRLASFSRLILFDKRGTGLSDRVPVQKLPTLEERMDDVRAVMDAAGSGKAALFGVSEGGPMSMLFATTYPERISALVLYGTTRSICPVAAKEQSKAVQRDDVLPVRSAARPVKKRAGQCGQITLEDNGERIGAGICAMHTILQYLAEDESGLLVETGSKHPETGAITMIPKLVPACQTPAKPGTVFVTNSEAVKAGMSAESKPCHSHPERQGAYACVAGCNGLLRRPSTSASTPLVRSGDM